MWCKSFGSITLSGGAGRDSQVATAGKLTMALLRIPMNSATDSGLKSATCSD